MVRPGTSAREFIEQSSCFCFLDGYIISFNDEVCCRVPTELKITGAVQAAVLLDILGKMPEEDLEVEDTEGGEILFKGKGRRFGVVRDAEVFLPVDRVEQPKKWKTIPPEFTEAVGLALHCVSKDESRFILTCLHMTSSYVESCDNLQAIRVKTETGLQEDVVIRGTSLEPILSLAMDQIAVTPAWLHFRNKAGLILSCRRYAETFSDISGILKTSGHPLQLPKGGVEASERAGVFAADKTGDPVITVSLKTGVMRFKGDGLRGWYKEVRKVKYEGPPLEFVIAPSLLQHLCEKHNEAQVNENRLKVIGGSYTYVTVLGQQGQEEEEEAPTDKE